MNEIVISGSSGILNRLSEVMVFDNRHNKLLETIFMTIRLSMIVFLLCLINVAGKSQAASSIAQKNKDLSTDIKRSTNDVELDGDYFKNIYRNFYETYRLGPSDEIAIRVLGQPDYSFPKLKVSPVGRVYHPLVGDIEVVGLTVPQLEKKLTADFSEYVINPKVSVSLEEAQSAKIGVLGEVKSPSIVIITKPMTVLEVINFSGGFTETADRRDVVILRQDTNGMMRQTKVDVKKIIDGKAKPEENVLIKAGDTVIVNGNLRKKVSRVVGSLGFVNFLTFLAFGRV
ncbi:MAG: polysaccharide biosynthesis/export family protein [Blastocatellia bacterium]